MKRRAQDNGKKPSKSTKPAEPTDEATDEFIRELARKRAEAEFKKYGLKPPYSHRVTVRIDDIPWQQRLISVMEMRLLPEPRKHYMG